MALMPIPNNDEDDKKPMIIGTDNRDNRKQSLGNRIFKKKPASPQKRSHPNGQKHTHFNQVNNEQIETLQNHEEKSKDSNIFTKLTKMGRMFKSKTNDVLSKSNEEINRKLKAEQQDKIRCFNMLLLGAGGSGKTTVFKQMDKLYNGDIEEKQLEASKGNIFRNILQDIYDLSKYNIKLNSSSTNDEYRLSNGEVVDICHRISTWPTAFILEDSRKLLNRELAEEIDRLWKDKAMKNTWEIRKNYHIMDNSPYFLDKILEIVPDPKTDDIYKCTFADFVHVRDQTTGIIVKVFLAQTEFGEYKFSVTDVGGQRAERRKWMRLFDNISVVVYIMSLSAYDQHLYEDNSRNCWDETLELFAKTSHEAVFDTTDWVIFFNKVDIFEKKIAEIPFTVYQPNFNELHAHNSQKVKEFIRDAFIHRFYDGLTQQRKKKRGNIYFHITCATKQESVGEIIQKVQIDLIKSQMKKMGYLL